MINIIEQEVQPVKKIKLKTIFRVMEVLGAVAIFNVTFFGADYTRERTIIACVGGMLLIGIPVVVNFYLKHRKKIVDTP